MNIEKEPFRAYNEDKSTDTFTIRLNDEERKVLESCKQIVEQTKDSTAMKQVFLIGAKVIHSKETAYILDVVLNNKRKNKRLGIIDYD